MYIFASMVAMAIKNNIKFYPRLDFVITVVYRVAGLFYLFYTT